MSKFRRASGRIAHSKRRLLRHIQAYPFDLLNRVRHGELAPQMWQTVWIDPAECRSCLYTGFRSGEVRAGDWDLMAVPLNDLPKVAMCREHWLEGRGWEETGIFDYVLAGIERTGRPESGCSSLEELERRYARLDEMFLRIASEGRLRSRLELGAVAYSLRERGGINVHLGRSGQPIFAGGGIHRLVVCQILGLDRIPAAIGLVHKAALPALSTSASEWG